MLKRLVAYYSRTGTTKAVGEAIANELGADSDEIIDLKKRTGLRPIRWLIAGSDAKREKLTGIKTEKKPERYDVVIIGTPVWAGRMAPAVRTYLKNHDLAGKKVGFFCTAGGDTEKFFGDMEKLVPKSTLVGNLGMLTQEVKSSAGKEKIKSFTKKLKSTARV
jgi:flavodoxin